MTSIKKLEAAIRLKEAIDQIPKHCNPIGNVVNLITDREDYGEEPDEDDTTQDESETTASSSKSKKAKRDKLKKERLTRPLAEMLRELIRKPPFVHDSLEHKYIDEQIEVDGSKITWDEETATRLFEQAKPSPFGNNRTMKTEYDDSVRKAREITEFTVSEELLSKVEQLWKKGRMEPEARAVPYKINAYGPGGHFRVHKDTPEKDLIGTFVLTLFQSRTNGGGNLVLHHRGEYIVRDDYCAFYTDVPHSVKKVTSGMRFSLTFKMFAKKVEKDPSSETVKIASLLKTIAKPFGILFEHEYTVADTEEKGEDSKIREALRLLGGVQKTMSVLVDFEQTWEAEEVVPPGTATVYEINDNIISAIADGASNEEDMKEGEWKDVPFLHLRDGTVWKQEVQNAAEHTGNQSEPGRETSVYVHRAVICQ